MRIAGHRAGGGAVIIITPSIRSHQLLISDFASQQYRNGTEQIRRVFDVKPAFHMNDTNIFTSASKRCYRTNITPAQGGGWGGGRLSAFLSRYSMLLPICVVLSTIDVGAPNNALAAPGFTRITSTAKLGNHGIIFHVAPLRCPFTLLSRYIARSLDRSIDHPPRVRPKPNVCCRPFLAKSGPT